MNAFAVHIEIINKIFICDIQSHCFHLRVTNIDIYVIYHYDINVMFEDAHEENFEFISRYVIEENFALFVVDFF